MRKLLICESPNKVKTLKDILGPSFIVMASVGHISEIKDGGIHNMGIDPKNKFKANYVVSPNKKEVVNKLKEQVMLADIVYIASDPDREGEAIAWSLKKFLKISDKKYYRVTFNEITKKAVLKAIENAHKIDDDLVNAAQTRQKLDKIVGYVLSPIARKYVYAKSVGRVQSAGLKLIVDREDEINNFIVETYFDLYLNFKKNNKDFKAKYFGTTTKEIKRLNNLEEVEKIVKDCKKINIYKIHNIEIKEKISNPRPAFTTSTFQQEVSSKLGMGVKQAMSYAQALFEGINIKGQHIALITYIRTDSSNISQEFLPLLENYVKTVYGNNYFTPIRKSKKNENVQEGHEAIRVVDLELTPEILSQYVTDVNLIKIYDIIYKRTIAVAMASSITSETTYTILNNKHLFNFTSKEMIFDGYKKVYGTFEDKDENIIKEVFELDETLFNIELEAIEKQTKPPVRYKEATFIKELEARGIGRPSTFASTVETLLSSSRGYCILQDKQIIPIEKGITLSRFLDKSFSNIININYTSELEKDLDLIASNKLNELDFLTEFYNKLIETVNKLEPIKKTIEISNKICPKCGKNLIIRNGKYGQFLGCSSYPNCRYIEKL